MKNNNLGDYLKLTSDAKEAGGVQQYLEDIEEAAYEDGYDKGHDDGVMCGAGIATAVIGGAGAVCYIAKKIKDRFNRKKETKAAKNKSDQAKEELKNLTETVQTEAMKDDNIEGGNMI